MMYATKIRMLPGYYHSQLPEEIDEIYITGCTNPGYFKKHILHDFLKENPGSIQVNLYPYPEVIPATSPYGEKYVRSSPNAWTHDNLMNLPRE